MTFAALNAHVPSIFSWIIYGQEKFIISFYVYCLLGESTFKAVWLLSTKLWAQMRVCWSFGSPFGTILNNPAAFRALFRDLHTKRSRPKGNWSDGKSFEMKNYRRLDAFATLRRSILLIERNLCEMKRFPRWPSTDPKEFLGCGTRRIENQFKFEAAFIWSSSFDRLSLSLSRFKLSIPNRKTKQKLF